MDLLTELCAEVRNYFLKNREDDIHAGTYKIEGGEIEPIPFLNNGQYFRIVGSVFNDGVWQYPPSDLKDEIFDGNIWAMAIPPSFIALAVEIDQWNADNAEMLNSPFSSESFGGYSYSKAATYSGGEPQVLSWRTQFAGRLRPYRRISVL